MRKGRESNWRTRLVLAAIASIGILPIATLLVVAQGQWEPSDEWRGQYKVGDQIELKINDAMWQKCKVVGNSPASAMRLDCEEYVEPPPGTYRRAGGIYTNTSRNDIRPFERETAVEDKSPGGFLKREVSGTTGAAKNTTNPKEKAGTDTRSQAEGRAGGIARPDAGECPFNEPLGAVAKNARPSEQLFKRVIFERYRDMESGRQVGVTFKTFSLANSFVNRLTRNRLVHDGAPQGATVYRYKTDFFTCVEYTDSILRTDVKEGYFACFKDKSGEWACAEDGRRNWDQKHISVK